MTGPKRARKLPDLVTVHVKLSRAEHEALRAIADEEMSSLQRLFRMHARDRIAAHARRRAG